MRTLSRLLILAMIFMFMGCACPKHDVINLVMTPFGPMIVETEKDNYNEERHDKELFLKGEGWITKQEYEALLKEYEDSI